MNTRIQWEDQVFGAMSEAGGLSRSDAQAVVEGQQIQGRDVLEQGWRDRLSPAAAAARILMLAEGGDTPSLRETESVTETDDRRSTLGGDGAPTPNHVAEILGELVRAVDAGTSADYRALQETGTMRVARAVLASHAPSHSDDDAVDHFAQVMKGKLAKKRGEGLGGWNDKTQCSAERLSQMLRCHIEKGDPVDVANLAMMLYERGERITSAGGEASAHAAN